MGWWFTTGVQGISYISFETCTGGAVINHSTFGVQSASSGARIHAFIIGTRPITGTFAIHYALGAAFNIRITMILRDTRTGPCSVALFTNGICTAGRWSTRGFGFVED